MVFEAEMTGGKKGSIAVDDITWTSGACPNAGSCDFDFDMCGYTSHTFSPTSDAETESRWLRLTNKMTFSPHGPSKDHTGSFFTGRFYYII